MRAICFFIIVLACITTVWADTVLLNNGDLLTGAVVEQTEQAIVFDHPVLGQLVIPLEQVKSQTQSTQESDSVAKQVVDVTQSAPAQPATTPGQSPKQPPEQPIKPVKPGLFGASLLQGWKKNVEVGFTGSEGNSETFNLTLGAHADHADDYNRWNFSAVLYYATSDGENITNEFYAQLEKDWLRPDSKWLYFGQGRYDFDQFQAWDHRLSGFGGAGYQFVENDVWQLRGKAGLGGNQTSGSTNDRFAPEVIATVETDWNISPNQKLAAATSVFPDLGETGRFRAISSADWTIKINHAEGLSLKFGLVNEYESITDGNAKHNDIKYYGSLIFDF